MTINNMMVDVLTQRANLAGILTNEGISSSSTELFDTLVPKVETLSNSIELGEITKSWEMPNSTIAEFYGTSGALVIRPNSSSSTATAELSDFQTSLEREWQPVEDEVKYVFLKRITTIGAYTLADLKNCEMVYDLTSSVTTVNAHAFECSRGILFTNIFDTVTSIGESAFAGCKSLAHVVVAKSCTIGAYAFANCTNVSIISGTFDTVGAYAFANCSSLRVISTQKISNTTTYTLPEHMCDGCTALMEVRIADATAYSISETAFANCINIDRFVVSEEGSMTTLSDSSTGFPWGATNATIEVVEQSDETIFNYTIIE